MFRIRINGEFADLNGDEVLVTSFAAAKLQDISSRSGEISNTYSLPITSRNLRIIGFANYPGSISTFPKRNNTCEIFDEGVVVIKGLCRLIRVKNTIDIAVYSGNSNWIAPIGDNELQELDFSDLDHMLSNKVINSNRLNTEGFVYPNVDYGTGILFNPAIYYSEIVQRIFKSVGYSVGGSLLNDNLYKSSAVIMSNKNWQQRNPGFMLRMVFNQQTNIPVSGQITAAAAQQREYIKPQINATVGSGFEWADPSFGIFTSITPLTQRDNIKIQGKITIKINTAPASGLATLILQSSTFPAGFVNLLTLDSKAYNNGSIITFDISQQLNFIANTQYRFIVNFTNNVTNIDCNTGYVELVDGIPYIGPQFADRKTDLAYSLPAGIKQRDFLKMVFTQFGAIVTTDVNFKRVNIDSFLQLQNNKPIKAADLGLVDTSEKPEVSFKFGDYGQTNYFRYAIDESDSLIDDYFGQGIIEIDNQLLPTTKIVYEAKFALIGRKVVSGVEVASFPLLTAQKTIPRIGRIVINNQNLVSVPGQPALTQNSHVFSSDLSFQSLIDSRYSFLKKIIQNQRVYKINLRIKNIHLTNLYGKNIDNVYLSYLRLLYINDKLNGVDVNGYFYINSINQYKYGKNESTEVELLPI